MKKINIFSTDKEQQIRQQTHMNRAPRMEGKSRQNKGHKKASGLFGR